MEARQLPSKVPCTLAGFQCRKRVEEEEEEARALNGTSVYGRIPTFTVLGPLAISGVSTSTERTLSWIAC